MSRYIVRDPAGILGFCPLGLVVALILGYLTPLPAFPSLPFHFSPVFLLPLPIHSPFYSLLHTVFRAFILKNFFTACLSSSLTCSHIPTFEFTYYATFRNNFSFHFYTNQQNIVFKLRVPSVFESKELLSEPVTHRKSILQRKKIKFKVRATIPGLSTRPLSSIKYLITPFEAFRSFSQHLSPSPARLDHFFPSTLPTRAHPPRFLFSAFLPHLRLLPSVHPSRPLSSFLSLATPTCLA